MKDKNMSLSANGIVINNLTKEYVNGNERILAVNDVSFSVGKCEFVTLLGQSGSGKTTLLTMIGGLCQPTSGSIQVDNINVYNLPQKSIADYRHEFIGFVFQSFQLIPYLTVEENVSLPLTISDLTERDRKNLVKEILINVHLENKGKRLINELSGGEQQRVAIARALVNDPMIILADEPTGNLDSKTSLDVMNIFRRLNENGKTIIMVTHNKENKKYSNRCLELFDGKLVNEEFN